MTDVSKNEYASDESPTTAVHRVGPTLPVLSDIATGAVQSPTPTVERFVNHFLRELNFGQGVLLSRSTINDQYLALAKTVR